MREHTLLALGVLVSVAPAQAPEEPVYRRMDLGPALNWTYQVGEDNFTYKGIAVRLDPGTGGIAKGHAWMVYDLDTLRVAAAWTGDEFIDWKGVAFDGSHNSHPTIAGDVLFTNPIGPGWADPASGEFSDPRLRGRDGRHYGPLPRSWVCYRGHYLHGDEVVLSYEVGGVEVLESPGHESIDGSPVFTRTMEIGPSSRDLLLRIAPEDLTVSCVASSTVEVRSETGLRLLRIPAAAEPTRLRVMVSRLDQRALDDHAAACGPGKDLRRLVAGGPRRWEEEVVTEGTLGEDEGPFSVDVLNAPDTDGNPWRSWLRFGGFDFFPDGDRAAISTWNGDVWVVRGIDGDLRELRWRRIATGLFQPLGLKIVSGAVFVACRDQIVELRDLNGDGETDFYRCFNNDHQVTEHFHEFAMGLQTDDEGNFYYAKSARHAKKALVPHHGTLLKVSADGSRTEIVANGFRAANGVCVNDDGTFFVTDQEGHWTPKNRINRVVPGGFYGNMMGYHDVEDSSDAAMQPPVCWITNSFDRSPAELVWVKGGGWGALEGSLLQVSYGTGRIFLVPHEKIGDRMQGGMVALPLPLFPTGVMRGRFHPESGQLYVCGLYGWSGNRTRPGGFYRVRYTGGAVNLPVGLRASEAGITLEFTDPLDPVSAGDAASYSVRIWGLKRSARYGSEHLDERELAVESVDLSADNAIVRLRIPEIRPTRCMEIRYLIEAADGTELRHTIHNTIHRLR